jgi:hypothetical protein
VTAVVGAAMNVIPYFFYDLSEIKQKGMIKVLQVRALFEDFGRGVLSDKDLVKAIELVREAKEYVNKEKLTVDKSAIKAAKTRADKKAARKALKAAKELGVTTSIDLNYRAKLWKYGKRADEVMPELTKYIDVVIANEEDCQKALGITSKNKPELGEIDLECYKDGDGNTYDFAFGLNWSGVIKDWRVEKYTPKSKR